MTSVVHLRDRELLRRARLGDDGAFDAFHSSHRGAVLAFFRVRVRSAEQAAVLTRETFIDAHRAVREERHQLPAMPIAWLLSIARHRLPVGDPPLGLMTGALQYRGRGGS